VRVAFVSERVPDSVAKGPKFRPQNSKGALQKFVRPEKLAAEFSLDLPKKGRKGAEKGPNFLEEYYSYKKSAKSTLHLYLS
jgi:hypothetical protein